MVAPDAKSDKAKKGEKDKKDGDDQKSGADKDQKSPDEKKIGGGLGGGGGMGGGSDGPDWDLLAQLIGTTGAAGADKDAPGKAAAVRKLLEESGTDAAAETSESPSATPPPPATASPPAATAAAAPAALPGGATGPMEVVECLASKAECAVWGAKVEGAYVGMKLAHVFQAGMAATAIAARNFRVSLI